MKLSTQEKIRTTEILLYLTSAIAFRAFDLGDTDYKIILSMLEMPYAIDIITSFKTQKFTDEWKELKILNDKIITNTANIMSCIDNEDIVSIFATYIYLYRKGFLSYNKNFKYDTYMKDFASLSGIDLFRGHGVCRSISQPLTDIYRQFGYDSRTLIVKANKESIKNNLHLSNSKLKVSKSGNAFAQAVGKLTNVLPIPNHAITLVSDGVNSYKLDPTNDCMFLDGKFNNLKSLTSNKGSTKNFMLFDLLYSSLGYINNDINFLKYKKQYNLPNISVEEYKALYLQALEICESNYELFEYFYQDNIPLYEEINEISKEQNGYLKRLIPIIPSINKRK